MNKKDGMNYAPVGKPQPVVREGEFVEMDHGHDFYAPQSFLAPDGRRIVIGWLDMWEDRAEGLGEAEIITVL